MLRLIYLGSDADNRSIDLLSPCIDSGSRAYAQRRMEVTDSGTYKEHIPLPLLALYIHLTLTDYAVSY